MQPVPVRKIIHIGFGLRSKVLSGSSRLVRPVDDADDLHAEAMALAKRYQRAVVDRGSVYPDAIEDLIVPLPTAECCPVWRVHIKVHWIMDHNLQR